MHTVYDEYAAVADDLIEEIQEMSASAANCIEQLRTEYGTRAAYLAAFALVICRSNFPRSNPSFLGEALKEFVFYEEMHETAEAIRLYQEAAAHLLSA